MIGQTETNFFFLAKHCLANFGFETEKKKIGQREKKESPPLTHWVQGRGGSTLIIVKENPQIGQTEKKRKPKIVPSQQFNLSKKKLTLPGDCPRPPQRPGIPRIQGDVTGSLSLQKNILIS